MRLILFLFAVLFSILSLSDLKSALSFLEFFLYLLLMQFPCQLFFFRKKPFFPSSFPFFLGIFHPMCIIILHSAK